MQKLFSYLSNTFDTLDESEESQDPDERQAEKKLPSDNPGVMQARATLEHKVAVSPHTQAHTQAHTFGEKKIKTRFQH